MNSDSLVDSLRELGLDPEAATVYLELVKGPATHLQLSFLTGINRTKVYRIISELEHRSLVTKHTNDQGTFLRATEPEALEVGIVNQEEKIWRQRKILNDLLPHLNTLHAEHNEKFTVNTYDGQDGLKQMCWHELKTKGELLSLGNGTVEDMISDERWAFRHRARQIDAGYRVREIVNRGYGDTLPVLASDQLLGSGLYQFRIMPPEITTFDSQTIIYNDTVAVYHWKHNQKVGLEVISATYAEMMRQIFKSYWQLALAPRIQPDAIASSE